MIQKLIKLANKFDLEGQERKADRLDFYIQKCAQEDREPTMEELLAEEKWLEEEGIMSDEDLAEGLSDEDAEAARKYLAGEPLDVGGVSNSELESMIKELEALSRQDLQVGLSQQQLMDRLSDLLLEGKRKESKNPERVDMGQFITPEASFLNDLVKLSDMLDQEKMYKEADFFTAMIRKIAGDGPDDFFDSFDEELEDLEDLSTEELERMMKEDESEDDKFYSMLGFVEKMAMGMFISLDAAQQAAKDLIQGFDKSYGVPAMPMDRPPRLPDNILKFKRD